MVSLFTLIISVIFGIFLPELPFNITALIGGVIAGYLMDGNYTDGMFSGGISAGISGIIYFTVINSLIRPLVMTSMVYQTPFLIVTILFFYFIFGVLGGLLGFAVRERNLIIQIMS